MTVQQAIQDQAVPKVHSDFAGGDRQSAHHSQEMTHEHETNVKAMKELEKTIKVCAVA